MEKSLERKACRAAVKQWQSSRNGYAESREREETGKDEWPVEARAKQLKQNLVNSAIWMQERERQKKEERRSADIVER